MLLDQNKDDAHLVMRCKQGDKGALKKLYVRHHGVLYAVVYRLTGSKHDAEDIVQETFLRAWRAVLGFREETSFRNWLIAIGVNLCRNLKRHSSETVKIEDIQAKNKETDALLPMALEQALAELPHGYREVLVMHDVMEFKHSEIAEVLGISEGTSKSQLHRARTKMRWILVGMGEPSGSAYAAGTGRQS